MIYYDRNSEEYEMLFGKNDTNSSPMPIYDGQPLVKEDSVLNQTQENNYLAQGAIEMDDENTVNINDSTFGATIFNFNINIPGASADAVLFDSRTLPLDSIQPAGIVIAFNNSAFAPPENVPPYIPPPLPPNLQVRRNYFRKEILSQPIMVQGLKIVAQSSFDAFLPITFINRTVNGKILRYIFHPSEYTSPSNFNQNIIDIPQFGLVLDSNTTVLVSKSREVLPPPPFPSNPTNKMLMFTTFKQSELTNNFFGKSVVKSMNMPRVLGIPLYDANRKPLYHVIKNNPFDNKENSNQNK